MADARFYIFCDKCGKKIGEGDETFARKIVTCGRCVQEELNVEFCRSAHLMPVFERSLEEVKGMSSKSEDVKGEGG